MSKLSTVIITIGMVLGFQQSASATEQNNRDSQKKPNILWIYIEDLHPWFSAYEDGLKIVKTPHFDSLAGQGVLFENAYVPVPVCSACRSSIITGQYAIRNGTQNHRSSRTPDARILLSHPTLPEIFSKADYYTYNNGKDDYNFYQDRHQTYTAGNPEDKKPYYGLRGKGAWRDRPAGVPFFGQIQTHGGKHAFNPSKVKKALGGQLTDPLQVTVPPQYPNIPEVRQEIALHYDTVKMTDDEIGKIVANLKADNEWENTILFIFSDHGGKFPRAKQFCYKEGLHVPLLVVVPMFQDKIKAGTRRKDLVNLMDVSATSLALAGLDIPDYFDSQNVFNEAYNRDYVFSSRDRCDFSIDRIRSVMGKRYHYIRNFKTDRPLFQHNYRSGQAYYKKMQKMYDDGKLTPAQAAPYGSRVEEELYDLETDPNEVHNLAASEQHQKIIAQMRSQLDQWIKKTGDQGQYTESKESLRAIKKRWRKNCINPEYSKL